MLCNGIITNWKLQGHYKVIDLDNGFFLAKLTLKEDLEHVRLLRMLRQYYHEQIFRDGWQHGWEDNQS
ncbi:conserved hypothetical protein [Ricinus communis]|uniref:Uncharacterized protein n=1 Tax=Ricinus communis TaxID=3988 RepID=B9SKW6_RICCO|nr:conserved hypothetical protein [Ricinus communis]